MMTTEIDWSTTKYKQELEQRRDRLAAQLAVATGPDLVRRLRAELRQVLDALGEEPEEASEPGTTTQVKDRMERAVSEELVRILLLREIACCQAGLAYPLPGQSGRVEAAWLHRKVALAEESLKAVRGE